MPPPTISCSTCLYYRPGTRSAETRVFEVSQTATTGECRRHVPVAVVVGGALTSGWPGANEDDWCGEYAAAHSS